MSDKITPAHLQRKAMLYIRQSSAHQVMHNHESRRLQYGMKERLQQLGWSEIETIDEDLGRSASGQVARAGFEGWWLKSRWAEWAQWRHVNSLGLLAIVGTGSS